MTDLFERLKSAFADGYAVERELPGGGMSRLFLAIEHSLHRQVIIKILPPDIASEVGAATPFWRPPDWAYAEVAREHGLKLARMRDDGPVILGDGRQLVVRDSLVGVMMLDGFAPLPVEEHIVFDETLYVPPHGTRNRLIEEELGLYQLDMGDGYLLHGTPHEESIGWATTHGCIRLRGQDIELLFANVPVGTAVYLY